MVSPCVTSVPSHFPGSKGCAIVEYRTAAEARRAIRSMTDTELRGRRGAFLPRVSGAAELLGVGMGWGLPFGKHTKKLLEITIFNGKTHYKWPFSRAMLNYQRITGLVVWLKKGWKIWRDDRWGWMMFFFVFTVVERCNETCPKNIVHGI